MNRSLVAQIVKDLPARQETQIRSLGREDPLEEGMATHSSIIACRIPWTEEPGRFMGFMGSQRVRHNWATNTHTHTHTHTHTGMCHHAALEQMTVWFPKQHQFQTGDKASAALRPVLKQTAVSRYSPLRLGTVRGCLFVIRNRGSLANWHSEEMTYINSISLCRPASATPNVQTRSMTRRISWGGSCK